MPAGAPAVVRIGDSVIMVSDGGGAREFLPTFLYVYVDNTDRVCQRAVEAGALIIEHPADMPYGDRRAMLRDPWGNTSQIATHRPVFRRWLKSGRVSRLRWQQWPLSPRENRGAKAAAPRPLCWSAAPVPN